MSDKPCPLYYLDVITENIGLLAGVNDVPIFVDVEGEGGRVIRPINEWIVPKDNRLTVSLFWPEDKPYEPGIANVKVTVFEADPDHPVPTPRPVLTTVEWPTPDTEEQYPYTIKEPFKLTGQVGCDLWNQAEVIEDVTPGDEADIFELLDGFNRVLGERKIESIYNYLDFRYTDDAAAYGKEPSALGNTIKKQYENLVNQDGFAVVPFSREDLEYEVVGNNQLIMVTRENFGKAIQVSTSQYKASIGIFVSRIKGSWVIARTT